MELDVSRGRIADAILDEIEAWRGSHKLARLRETLETQENVIPFWAEAMVARHIVHHMRDGDHIRVRMLAGQQPLPEAEAVTPTLEDSYLWLTEKRS